MTRCAIYTRKSSEEGLDQQFNSLDAQREACEAYVLSQSGEGWRNLVERYDDGGFSGGSMDRPGLRKLLADIHAGKVDVVVVYKIDRLTRSLADFARIVEQFDAKGVSFVSVTQAFNTTSSMGRLTLNVLLSFAQFEREVTGERIRDKIAASKAKGMWMGGLPPMGYDPPADGDRVLRVHPTEAIIVRDIFERYLELKSVHALVADLANRNIWSKARTRRDGSTTGGLPFGRGALFHLLRNKVYVGKIVHKGEVFDGLHEPIVPQDLFDRVQILLGDVKQNRQRSTINRAPLAGRIFMADGSRLTPTHSRGASGKTYRYYVPLAAQVGRTDRQCTNRIPARSLETRMRALLKPLVADESDALALPDRIEVHASHLTIVLPIRCWPKIAQSMDPSQTAQVDNEIVRWNIPLSWSSRRMTIATTNAPARRDATLIRALRAAHAMLGSDRRGHPVMNQMPRPRYERRLSRLAFLSPALQAMIIAGHQPANLTLEKVVRGEVPLDWNEQLAWASRR